MNNAKLMVATIFFEALALQTWSTMMHFKHQANWFEIMKLNKMGRRMQVGWLVSPMNIWQFAQESLDCDQQKCCGVGWIPTLFVKSQHCWPTELPESTAFVATKKAPYLFLYGRDPNISSLNQLRSQLFLVRHQEKPDKVPAPRPMLGRPTVGPGAQHSLFGGAQRRWTAGHGMLWGRGDKYLGLKPATIGILRLCKPTNIWHAMNGAHDDHDLWLSCDSGIEGPLGVAHFQRNLEDTTCKKILTPNNWKLSWEIILTWNVFNGEAGLPEGTCSCSVFPK